MHLQPEWLAVETEIRDREERNTQSTEERGIKEWTECSDGSQAPNLLTFKHIHTISGTTTTNTVAISLRLGSSTLI